MRRYDHQRASRTPPHVSLKSLRKAAGLTHEQVCRAVGDATDGRVTLTRGALSAIESGLRGASAPMLRALELAYGLDPGDITTSRRQPEPGRGPRSRDLTLTRRENEPKVLPRGKPRGEPLQALPGRMRSQVGL